MAKDYLSARLASDDIDTGEIQIHTVDGVETISQPFQFDLEIICTGDQLDLDDVVGAQATLLFERAEKTVRQIHGMIESVEDLYDTEHEHTTYRLRLRPRMWRMSYVETLDIFMDMSIPEVIETKLKLVGLSATGVDYELRLTRKYPKREFVVQYQETDLSFISRLCEHQGISFFFEHDGEGDKIVFTDGAAGFTPVAGDAAEYRGREEQTGVYSWTTKRTLTPSAYVCRDYNYRTPTLELQADHVLDGADAGGIVEYGGHFKTIAEGTDLATVRAQERLSTQLVHTARSDDQRLSAGHMFSLEGHQKRDGQYLVVEIHHQHSQTVGTGRGKGDERTYRSVSKCIDAAIDYRPPRVTHRPRIYGVLTGMIESFGQGAVKKLAEIDDWGRYTVRFLFDTAPPGERKASRPVRRIQAAVGPNYGMHFPLRPGVEVLLVFIDGDPDRPLIVGAVPNPVTPTPVDGPTQTKNRLKTESGVLFEIEDGSGS